ncbi:homoserine kinase [Thermoplasma sp.]|uniref:homoserine kinase n=1 Tax=Thermoplasma sp. TaxID=1973142 RepID=UPI0025F4A9BB|nr:homoserine kinase [Thermoplasma sp.]
MKVTASAPCSSANLGSGFDNLAIALDAFHDRITVVDHDGFSIIGDGVPSDPERNTAGLAALKLIDDFDLSRDLEIRIEKGVPKGLGLGSSGASAAAAVKALDEYFDLGLSQDEMISYAMIGEIASSGSPHPDNVSASISGGLVLVTRDGGLRASKINISGDYRFLIAIPDVITENKTRAARQMLPPSISLESYSRSIGRVASLIAGFMSGNRDLIRAGMNDDVVEPSRISLFPYYHKMKRMALANEAVGVAVSGAGPSILMVCDDMTEVSPIIEGTHAIFAEYGISGRIIEAKVSGGAYVEGSPVSD